MSRHIASRLVAAALFVAAFAPPPVAAQEEAQPRVVPEQAVPAPPPSPARAEAAAIPRFPAAGPAASPADQAGQAVLASAEQARPRSGNRGQAERRAPRATGGGESSARSGQAERRAPRATGGGESSARGGQAVRRAPPATGDDAGAASGGQAVRRGQPREGSRVESSSAGGRAVERYSRPRTDQRVTGQAVPRRTPPVGVRAPYYYGRSPWYYSPYGFGWSLGYFYNPYWWGNVYYPPYPPGYGYVSYYDDMGAVRLKVKPREAQVFVDGYYVGIVDEFDGRFQRLRLDEGPQRIEIRLEGYETLVFDVRVLRGRTINLTGALRPLGLP